MPEAGSALPANMRALSPTGWPGETIQEWYHSTCKVDLLETTPMDLGTSLCPHIAIEVPNYINIDSIQCGKTQGTKS